MMPFRFARPVAALLLACAPFLAGCSTFTIDETDVFLPKPSVTPQTFDVDGVTLDQHVIPVVDTTRSEITRSDTSQSKTPQSETTEADAAQSDADRDTLRLTAWHLTRPDAKGTVLLFGGNGFYLVQSLGYIRALTEYPVNVMMWDYRGYGWSEGTPGVNAFKHDALAVYDYLTTELGADSSRVVLHGHSLGTFLATYTATKRPAAGVVLENPATDVRGWVRSVAPWYVRLFVDVEIDPTLRGESNVERVQALDGPLLVIGGENDNVTTPDMARALHEAARDALGDAARLLIVDGGGHNELYASDAYDAAYRRLIATALP